MYGFTLPEIRERVWRNEWEIDAKTFEKGMAHARAMHCEVFEWSGEDRDGNSLTVVWVRSSHTRWLLSAFYFTERQKAA